MFPPDWTTLAPLLDRVLDAEPDRREALLDEVSAGDPALRAVLARLVAECDQGVPLFDRPAAERFGALAEEDGAPRLPAILGGHYETSRELGRGGMARVYLARDTKHGRDVAVKVIRRELAASLGRDRFLREIAIAARLRHPNIVPLYDSGDADGLLYFVMPYEDGPSLRSRLAREGPLSIPDARARAARRGEGAAVRARARCRPPRHQAGQRDDVRWRRRGDGLRDREGRQRSTARGHDQPSSR